MDLIVGFPARSDTSSPPLLRKPRVSFADNLEVKHIEYPANERAPPLWFSDDDVHCFKYQTALEARALADYDMTMADLAELDAAERNAFVGLEAYLGAKTRREIRIRRKALAMAVFLEQRRQIHLGIKDPDMVARLAAAGSDWSRRRARMVGSLHAAQD